MQTYQDMVTAAARDFEIRTRLGQPVHMWAIATDEKRNGRIHVGTDCPEFGARYIRPSDNGASAHARWDSIPYSALRDILARACGRDPILPIHSEPAAA